MGSGFGTLASLAKEHARACTKLHDVQLRLNWFRVSSLSISLQLSLSRAATRARSFLCAWACVCVYVCVCVCVRVCVRTLHCIVSRLISPLALPFFLSRFLSLTRLRVLSLFLCVCARACACALCRQLLRSMRVDVCVSRVRVHVLTFSRALSPALVRSLVSFV